MMVAIRLLIALLLLEMVVCSVWAVRQLQRPEPILPAGEIDDPLLPGDLRELADRARAGDAADWRALADALLGQGYYSEAELNYRVVLEQNPRDHAAQYGLAFCLERTGRLMESNAAYEAAAALPPRADERFSTKDRALYAIGRNLLREEKTAEAMEYFQKNAGHYPSIYQRAKWLIRSEKAAEALPMIDKALEELPNSMNFLTLRYRALDQLGRDRDAALTAEALDRSQVMVSLNVSGDYANAHFALAGLQAYVARYNEVVSSEDLDQLAARAREILELTGDRPLPHRISMLNQLGVIGLKKRDVPALREIVPQLHALQEFNADLLQMEGAAYVFGGDPEQGVPFWEKAAATSPNVFLLKMLEQYFGGEKNSGKQADYRFRAALLEARLSYRGNQLNDAKQSIDVALAARPEAATGWFALGQIEQGRGQLDAAIAAYRKCLEFNPYHGRAIERLQQLETPAANSSG